MKQFLTADQTAKLIELGFEKPRALVDKYYDFDAEAYAEVKAYSIGELIEMLDGVSEHEIIRYGSGWEAGDALRAFTSEELIDALFDMVLRLKEEGVI